MIDYQESKDHIGPCPRNYKIIKSSLVVSDST